MAEEYGFDANFVTNVPDYLKCSVCHFVLRNPIQIMNCSHRYCKPCFESMKRYAEHHNTQLCCSIDHENIDLRDVFQDTGVARVIENLEVKCRNVENGCTWTSELKGLTLHEKQCKHHVINVNIPVKSSQLMEMASLTDVIARISKLEESANEKEKDILHLKFNFNELKKEFNEKDAEIELFRVKNFNLASEVRLMRDQNEEFKKLLEKENEVLTQKNQLLENKVASCGEQLLESKLDVFKQTQIELKIEEIARNFNSFKDETEKIKEQLSESIEMKTSSMSDKMTELFTEVCRIEENLNTFKHQVTVMSNKFAGDIIEIKTQTPIEDRQNEPCDLPQSEHRGWDGLRRGDTGDYNGRGDDVHGRGDFKSEGQGDRGGRGGARGWMILTPDDLQTIFENSS